MTLQTKIGLAMTLPEHKLPGFYAQIVKALAGRTQLFDRDKDMLIVSTAEDRTAVLEVMQRYKIATEELELLLLPDSTAASPLFDDYGFMTRLDNRYLYLRLVVPLTLHAAAPDAEPTQALQQLDEYVIAVLPSAVGTVYVIDRRHDELAERIAAAYRCTIAFMEF